MLRIVLLMFCLTVPASAQIVQFSGASVAGWQVLRIGGGGFITGIDIECDQGESQCNGSGTATTVVRADVYGAYWFNPNATPCGNTPLSGCWQQIVTTNSMPAANVDDGGGNGVYEIAIAPSNTSHFYMMYDGIMFTSANKGSTWAACAGWTPVTANANDNSRTMGRFMAIDPGNESYLLVGTPAGGVFYSTNGCSTFTHIAAIPNSSATSNGYGNALVAFDPSTTSGGSTSRACASSYGHGVYCTTTGLSGTWAQLSSTPTTHWHMAIDASGNLFLVDNSQGGGGELHEYTGGSWSQVSSGTIGNDAESIAISPANANYIDVMSRGSPGNIYNTTGGAGGSWYQASAHTRTANDVPWLGWTAESYMSAADIAVNPAIASRSLSFAEGIGVWSTTSPVATGATIAWTSNTAGIEELVSQQIISPPGGNPVALFEDRPLFKITAPNTYPSTVSGCANPQSNSLIAGWSADWAQSNNSLIAAMCTYNYGSPWTDESGTSSDGGATWTAFSSIPSEIGSGYVGGCMAIASSSAILWIEGNSNEAGTGMPYYWNGSSWTKITTMGQTGWPQLQGVSYIDCASDKVNANTFYVYTFNYNGTNSDGFFVSTNGGSSWTKQCSPCGPSSQNFCCSINGFFTPVLGAMPGQAGELFFTAGRNTSVSHPASTPQPLYVTTDSGATWTAVSNMNDIWALGFGAAKSGSSYAAIYVWGWYNGTRGTWRSNNNGSTWTQIDNGYPLGVFSAVTTLSGDNNTYGKLYECFQGSACVYGQFNYLLSRDLKPANDNNNIPAFLNEAA